MAGNINEGGMRQNKSKDICVDTTTGKEMNYGPLSSLAICRAPPSVPGGSRCCGEGDLELEGGCPALLRICYYKDLS